MNPKPSHRGKMSDVAMALEIGGNAASEAVAAMKQRAEGHGPHRAVLNVAAWAQVSSRTVYRWIERFPEVAEVFK